jgi:hypothetical protein
MAEGRMDLFRQAVRNILVALGLKFHKARQAATSFSLK